MNWIFFSPLYFFVILSISFSARAQFYFLNSEKTVTSSVPQSVNSVENQLGVLPRGTVFEVLEAQAQAVRIKLWILKNDPQLEFFKKLWLQNYLSINKDLWLYKDDTDPKSKIDFIKIKPERSQLISPESIISEAKSPSTDCLDGSCEKNLASTKSESAIENTEALREIADKINPDADASESKLEQQIKNFSESAQVSSSIEYALKNKRSHSTGKCYRSVKFALAASPRGTKKEGLIPGHFSDSAAVQSKESLKKFGFINLLEKFPYSFKLATNPSEAPKGAVLVYSSGLRCKGTQIKDCGHVEIKTSEPGKPGYVSDYYSDDPISETAHQRSLKKPIYKLVAIMIKPMDTK